MLSIVMAVYYPLVIILDVALLMVLLYLVRLEYRAGSVAMFFWATLLGIYALPAWRDIGLAVAPITAAHTIRLAGDLVLVQAPLFALLFCGAYLAVRLPTLRKSPAMDVSADVAALDAHDSAARRLVNVMTVAACAGALSGAYAIYTAVGWDGLGESGYTLFRLEADPTFMRPAIYLLAASSAGVFLAWRQRMWLSFAIIVSATVGYFLLCFSRQVLMFMLAPFAVYLLYAKRSIGSRIVVIVAAVGVYYMIIFLLFLRYEGSVAQALAALFSGEVYENFTQHASHEGGETQLRYVYYFCLQNPDAASSVMPGQTYLRLLMLPLPSEYAFGFKPGLVDFDLWTAFHDNSAYAHLEGASLHGLIFSDSIMNFGWFGSLLGAFWALVARGTAQILSRVPAVVRIAALGPLGFGAVMVARGSVYNSSAYVFWAWLIILFMHLVAKHAARIWRMPVREMPATIQRPTVK